MRSLISLDEDKKVNFEFINISILIALDKDVTKIKKFILNL